MASNQTPFDIDVDEIVDALEQPYEGPGQIDADKQLLTLTEECREELHFSSTKWLNKVRKYTEGSRDPLAENMAAELLAARRRTAQWLGEIGYQGILQMWRDDTKGLVGIVRRFEKETGEDFSPSLILDYMESFDTWQMDLEAIYRGHAFLHDGRWQVLSEGADEMNLADVTKAKQTSQLAFERAGTLNRTQFGKTAPRDESFQASVINVNISKDGVNEVGVDRSIVAQRQQLTAKARVRYGTSNYVDPPGLVDWQSGRLSIPDDKVDNYLMLEWVPEGYDDVLPEAVVQSNETETHDSVIEFNPLTGGVNIAGS